MIMDMLLAIYGKLWLLAIVLAIVSYSVSYS